MHRLIVMSRALSALAVVVAALALPSALADDASRERIFLVFEGDDAASLEREALKFQSTVLKSERFEFAGTQEMEAVYASCSEDIGTDAQTRRDCQLRAANRIMVTQVLQLRGDKLDKKTWDVALEVWSPESNGLLWGDTLEVEAGSLRKAAREAYPELAERYLCWRGVESACPSKAPASAASSGTASEVPAGMVIVPGGTFAMGLDAGQIDTAIALCEVDKAAGECEWERERLPPRRDVEISPYYIDLYEVTVEAYEACVAAGACQRVNKCQGFTGSNFRKEGHGRHPANCVSWQHAVAYCAWEGKRLPSEAEWEMAARGTDGRLFPWGDAHPSSAGQVGNFRDATLALSEHGGMSAGVSNYTDGFEGTAPVGSFAADKSPYGVYDMAGNVSEWTSSTGEEAGHHVERGSNFWWRASWVPIPHSRDTADAEMGATSRGFRCAKSAP